jgi:AraC-like DNA-binding protein
MSAACKTIPGSAFVQVGAYFSPSGASDFLELPICDLADKVVGLETQWGAEATRLDEQLNHQMDDSARVVTLEAILLRRLVSSRRRRRGFDSSGLAALATRLRGRITVDKMADLAGVSRQYLSRVFQNQIGVSPKLYCRLARFRALLEGSSVVLVDWSGVAATMGYSDQSHMIAEFRKFSGITPAQFIRTETFHPFRWPSLETQTLLGNTKSIYRNMERLPSSAPKSVGKAPSLSPGQTTRFRDAVGGTPTAFPRRSLRQQRAGPTQEI